MRRVVPAFPLASWLSQASDLTFRGILDPATRSVFSQSVRWSVDLKTWHANPKEVAIMNAYSYTGRRHQRPPVAPPPKQPVEMRAIRDRGASFHEGV
jgi:hypothetical protein